MTDEPNGGEAHKGYQLAGLALGPLGFAALLASPAPSGLEPAAWATAAVAVWMAVWWASEAVPLAATALLPLALFPVLGISGIERAAAPFANPLIFLFLGGFLIALTMQRWNLHRRIALHIVAVAGSDPATLVGGVMLATACLSMWISNTAATMMMIPIAVSLVAVARPENAAPRSRDESQFAAALMLGTAYAASIGGLATLVGTPPNALFAAFMAQTYGIEVGFARWMMVGVPMVALLLPLAWLVLTRVVFRLSSAARPEGGLMIAEALRATGPMTPPEKRVAAVFVLVAFLWITNPLLANWIGAGALSDTGVAIAGALSLFVIPADWKKRIFLLDWAWAGRMPWHILILFGGGLSLARAVDETGLAAWIAGGLAVPGALPAILLTAAAISLIIFLTELASNTATTAAFLPVVGAVAIQAGLDPFLLAVPVTIAASCAFMLPVATAPNAIVYGTGHVGVGQMMRAGLVLNLIGIAVITVAASLIVKLVFS